MDYQKVIKRNDQRPIMNIMLTSSSTFQKASISAPVFPVPSMVKLFLRPFVDDSYLLRLHNMDYQSEATINIPTGWKLTEYTLSANQLMSDWQSKQYKWKEDSKIEEKNTMNEDIYGKKEIGFFHNII